MSVGAYCNQMLRMYYSTDSKSWKDFKPGEWKYESFSEVSLWPYAAPLMQEDWRELEQVKRFEPSLAAPLFVRAQRLLDQDNLRYAFIEAVTALEILVDEHWRLKASHSKPVADAFQAFWALPLPTQVVAAALGTDVETADLEATVAAIAKRNKIVHDGVLPVRSDREMLGGLFRMAAKLLPGPSVRFAAATAPEKRPGMTISVASDSMEPISKGAELGDEKKTND